MRGVTSHLNHGDCLIDDGIDCTIGQPDTGAMSPGSFELVGGFWFQIPPSDCNDDGIVNLIEHSSLADCLTGPYDGVASECTCFELDHNGHLDLADFGAFQQAFGG